MKLTILYEDDDVVAINKPAGLVVHSDGKVEQETVTDWVMEKYPELKEVGEPMVLRGTEGVDQKIIYRPGIVHRIDKGTSGVLLIAKNQRSFENLKGQFQDRDIQKTYNAFVYGEMDEEDGTIDRPIGKSNKDFRMWSAQRGARGEMRDALTEYKVLRKTEAKSKDLGVSYLEVSPKTGRTHQIRVHLKAINHPIICDKLYAPKRAPMLGFERMALHARSVTFMNLERESITVEAPLPEDFEQALKTMDQFAKI